MNQLPTQPQGGMPPTPLPPSVNPPPPGQGTPPLGAPGAAGVYPLYQDSINSLQQVSQLGNPAQASTQTPQQGGLVNDIKDVGVGLLKGAGQTLFNIGSIPDRIGDLVTGSHNTAALPDFLKPTNTAQKVGQGAEQILEFLGLPEMGAGAAAAEYGTEAAGLASKLGAGAELAGKVGSVAKFGVKALAEGATNVALGQLHNSTTPGLDFAAGAAAPLLGAGLSKAWEALPSIIKKGTGLTDAIVQQATSDPAGFKAAVQNVAENPQAPYVTLAHDVFNGLMQGKQAAKDAYQAGLEKVVQLTEGKTYNISPQIQELSTMLKTEYGLPVQLARNADGTMSSAVKLVSDTPNGNPFSAVETRDIEGLMNDMRNANGKSFQGLVNFQKKVDSYFDRDVFGNAKSTPYNSVITKLSNIVDDKVSQVAGEAMPTMEAINQQYSTYKQVFKQFGKTFVDGTTGTPQVSSKAESFLSNLLGKNKSTLQGNVVKNLEKFTGVPILDKAIQTKAAVDFSKLAAEGKMTTVQKLLAKGSRYVGAGIGAATHGLPGIFTGGAVGEGVGKVVAGIGNPNLGLKAIGLTQKIGDVASNVADTGIVKGLSQRFKTP